MRTGASDIQFRGRRSGSRLDSRRKSVRKPPQHRIDLEGLELRTLLATIPAAATTTAAPIALSNLSSVATNGNANSPTVSLDPLDPNKAVAVWVVNNPSLPAPTPQVFLEAAYTTDGGQDWLPVPEVGQDLFDPTTTNPTIPYAQQTNPSVGFDRNGHFFVLESQHNVANTSGAIALERYDFTSDVPVPLDVTNSRPPYFFAPPNYNILYQWIGSSDAAVAPTMKVDDNVASFTDPTTGQVQGDPYASVNTDPNPGQLRFGDIYVAWASIDIKPSLFTDVANFNPNRIKLIVSSDGGNNFTSQAIVNSAGNFGTKERDSQPQLVIGQNGGQVTVGWSDFGSFSTASPPQSQLLSSSVTPGLNFVINNNNSLVIPDATPAIVPIFVAAGGSPYPADPTQLNTVVNPTGISLGDINGDGNPDIVYTNKVTGQMGVLLNNGNGTFSPPASGNLTNVSGAPNGVALGDFTGTNRLDASVAVQGGGVSFLTNIGAGDFAPLVNNPFQSGGGGTKAVAAGNLLNSANGQADIVAVNQTGNTVGIFLGTSGGNPPGPPVLVYTITTNLQSPDAVTIGDFNNDNLPDIAVANSASGTVTVFQNISSGGVIKFDTGTVFAVGNKPVSLAVADFNNDGNKDLVVANQGDSTVTILQNTTATVGGAITFAPAAGSPIVVGGAPVGVTTGQFSGSGNSDFAVVYPASTANSPVESTVQVYLGNGNFTFNAPIVIDANGTNPTAIASRNLDNKNWDDIVVTNAGGSGAGATSHSSVSVFLTQPFTVPGSANDKVNVNIPANAINNLSNLTVSTAITDATLADLRIVLVAPNGDQITLVLNQNSTTGTARNFVGITGANLGITNGFAVGTTFDDNATRDIFDPNNAGTNANNAPFIGNYRPEGNFGFPDPPPLFPIDTLVPLGQADTLQNFLALEVARGDINGMWNVQVTDVHSSNLSNPASQFINFVSLAFTTAFNQTGGPGLTPGSNVGMLASAANVAGDPLFFSLVAAEGSLTNNFPRTSPVTPNGVGPGLVLAQDNTLGSFSPHQGRIYAAFVGYYNFTNFNIKNPTTNTDIFLLYSDDGGRFWNYAGRVNNDESTADGTSQSNTDPSLGVITGRTQFQPAIAVDQATGTLVMSWRDARDDASNARVATYLASSIDGGLTFSPQTYANPPSTAVDAITGQTVVVGPHADNQSAGDGQRDATFGYGNQMGLAVFDGKVYPIWAANFNQGVVSNGAIIGTPLNIVYQPMVIAAGPRIIGSTMGPVVANTLTGSANDLPQFIPEPPVPPGSPTTSTITLAGDPNLLVDSLQVNISLTYAMLSDLTVKLIAPSGAMVTLFGAGQLSGADLVNTTFSDSASQLITAGSAPYTGTFQSVVPLSTLKGLQARGTYTLEIDGGRQIDTGQGPRAGILNSWSLTVNAVTPKPTSFDVTFDRPIDPDLIRNSASGPTFTPQDVEVFYHDTTNGSTLIPLMVTGVAPIPPDPSTAGDPTQNGVFGYTRFSITFNPDKKPDGSPSGIQNYTGTYSYLVAPDNGNGSTQSISSPIRSFVNTPVPQPVISPATDANAQISYVAPGLPVPTWGTGGSGINGNDFTVSTLNLSGYGGQTISGLTVNLNLTHTQDGDLDIFLFAPNGQVAVLYYKPGDTSQNFTNVTFSDQAAQSILSATGPYDNKTLRPAGADAFFGGFFPLTALNGSPVNGTYELVIYDGQVQHFGNLNSWSITVNSTAIPDTIVNGVPATVHLQNGASMDQNADATTDQNPLTVPFTGFTPGDIYAAPRPAPSSPFTFNSTNIIAPPFDQNTLPLIFPGPYVVSTQAVGTSGQVSTSQDNLLLNDTSSTFKVTFDRPMQVGSFSPSDILQIMGPTGSLSGPQFFPSDATGQTIPAATATGPGTLNSTVTVPGFGGTFKVAKVTVQLNATFPTDSNLAAVLIAPDGTQVPLFAGVGGTGSNFVNTIFDDSAVNAITAGTAPFTGSFKPSNPLSALNGKTVDIQNAVGQWVPGIWTLQLTNSKTGVTGTLNNWSLSITPVLMVAAVNPQTVTFNGNQIQVASTFTIGFPMQQLSGTYTLALGPNILDTNVSALYPNGQPLDTSLNAGLSVLRGQDQDSQGTPTTPVTPVVYNAPFLPRSLPDPAVANVTVPDPMAPKGSKVVLQSTIVVPDSFIVQGDTTTSGVSGLLVGLNLTYPNDPDLEVTLSHNGTTVILFNSVGQGARTANFTGTILDDNGATPIQSGGAPFFGTYKPQQSLATAFGNGSVNAQGDWTLTITNTAGTMTAGTLSSWSLTFQKPQPTSGLGQTSIDNVSASFRIFTMDPTNALSRDTWTAVGPADIAGASGRIGGIAVDLSDPSGNTVYVAGASGGVWKTTNFLTTDPLGPTYIPLTDFGPTLGINIGGLTVFSRNHDPNQSVIIASTGEGDTGTPGAGFLISKDGGATWNLYDSTVNVDANGNVLPINSPLRDRKFVGTTSFKVVVDPTLDRTGGVVIYAALSGTNGGIWRSLDTGNTWQLMRPGQATDVVLDPASNTGGSGNLQVVYGAFRGDGVYLSPNQGQVWNLMAGGIGNPLISNLYNNTNVNPTASPTPNGAKGRIVLAKPALTGNAAEDAIYQGWLYAAVATPGGGFDGLYVTKDFGQNWTKVRIASVPLPVFEGNSFNQAIPTNDINQPDYNILGGSGALSGQGNYDITLNVDPTNPDIVYLGGDHSGGATGLIRVDVTALWDAHALVPYASNANDGGALDLASTGPARVNDVIPNNGQPPFRFVPPFDFFADTTPYFNFIRDPSQPFYQNNSSLRVFRYASFTNNGFGVKWTPFDMPGTDYHRVYSMIDPTTGLPRLIFGNDQGIWSVLDNNGQFQVAIGVTVSPTTGQPSGGEIGISSAAPGIDRNGNLQITQFYYGAAQPSNLGAQIATALLYGSAQDNGGPVSAADVLTTGNIRWSGPGGDASGVGTDQQGLGTAYQYFWPCCFPKTDPGAATDFFQFIGPGLSGAGYPFYVGRTFGLLQQSGGLPTPDPQWPFTGGANFAVNPLNGNQVIISSSTGRIFATENQGVTWFQIGDPSVFNNPGSFSVALAYGAPDPSAPAGVGNLDNFLYVGTALGQIFVSQTGGGAQANSWSNISLGLDGSPVERIITNPNRGSHEAYAVTANGVFHIQDSILLANNPTNAQFEWRPITANLHNLAYSILGQPYDPTTDPNGTKYNQALGLDAIEADWRYAIPNAANDPINPGTGVHPVLYVSANSGVYRSIDDGLTWTLFPNTALDGSPINGGYLPHTNISDLSLALGNIDVQTGRPNLAGPYDPLNPTPAGSPGDPDILLATTFGRGSFGIKLAPLIFPNTVNLGTANISGTDPATGTQIVTGPITFQGLSEITGFGNATRITVVDITNPANPKVIAGFDPSNVAGTNIAKNWTDALGNINLPFDPATAYTSNGLKTVQIYATDDAGAVGNKVTLQFTLNDSNLPQPPPTAPPTVTLAISPSAVRGTTTGTDNGNPITISVTNLSTPGFMGTVSTNAPATVKVFEFQFDSVTGTYDIPYGSVPNPTIAADGSFSFVFSNPLNLTAGNFKVDVVAQYNPPNDTLGSTTSAPVYVQIDDTTPGPVTDFRLNPADDTGIVGDNITSDRTPQFLGTAPAGDKVELFQVGNPVLQNTVIASATTSTDANGATYNFSIQLPFVLNNGMITLEVVVVDAFSGNASPASNQAAVTIVSIASDYNGDGVSDPALFNRDVANNQLEWLVQSHPAGSSPAPWFAHPINFTGTLTNGSASVTGITSTKGLVAGQAVTGTGIPAGTTIQTVNSATAVTLSATATASGVQNLSASSNPIVFGPASVAFTGTLTNGSASVSGISSTAKLLVGQIVTGTGIPAGTTIQAINGATAITLSAKATVSGSESLSASIPVTNLVPFQGDLDGDGFTDLAYYQLSNATWYMYDSKSQTASSFPLGTPNSSVPVMGSFDANGPTELAVFTINAQGQGVWSIASNSGLTTVTFGTTGDIPVPGNYDGVSHDEVAVYRPSTGQFLVDNNGNMETINIPGIGVGTPDLSSLVPVPGNYDPHLNNAQPPAWIENTEAAVYDPKTGVFTILGPNGVYTVSSGFQPGDIPAPADYSGNGSTQPVVFRPSTGKFIGAGGTIIATFGQASDVPLAAPLSYRTDPPSDSTGTTGTGTGTGTTGTGTGTGTGTTGTGTTGTGTTGTGTTGSSSSGQGSSSGSTTTSPPSQNPVSNTPHPGPSSHKKKFGKAASRHKKPVVHAKHKTVQQHAAKPNVHVVSHPAKKVVKVVTASSVSAKPVVHVVDLALAGINLRRSSSGKGRRG
jgi:subtilisin-like proprotein convertase family protein